MQASQINGEESRYYVEQIKAMKDYELTTLYVDMLHLLEREEVLARAIRGQYYRFVKYSGSAANTYIKYTHTIILHV